MEENKDSRDRCLSSQGDNTIMWSLNTGLKLLTHLFWLEHYFSLGIPATDVISYHAISDQIEYLVPSDDTLLLKLEGPLQLGINKEHFNRGITAMTMTSRH